MIAVAGLRLLARPYVFAGLRGKHGALTTHTNWHLLNKEVCTMLQSSNFTASQYEDSDGALGRKALAAAATAVLAGSAF